MDQSEQCDHCLRTDVDSWEAGMVEVTVPILDPYDHDAPPIGHRTMLVCRPNVPYRPRCNTLVLDHGHERHCWTCYSNYPPGMEKKYNHSEGSQRWAA